MGSKSCFTSSYLAVVLSIAGLMFGADLSSQPAVPRIDEEGWWQVASDPDLGELTSDKQEPVDFGVWQAADGTWQLWSCIRNTKERGVTRLFHRWEGKTLHDTDWRPMGIAMRGDPKFGEREGGMQAPYVIRVDGKYHMFYGDWDNICLATSDDGKHFERASIDGGGPQLFTEGPQNNARDAMVLKVGDLWHCYYSAMPTDRGAMFVRRAKEFTEWTDAEPIKVVAGGAPGKMWYEAECPHVVKHGDYFYLFRTSNYLGTPKTTIYASLDPTDFGIDDDAKIVATLPVAAPEIIKFEGKYWIAALNPQLDGIRITQLEFVADSE
jgi:hypothetical protein